MWGHFLFVTQFSAYFLHLLKHFCFNVCFCSLQPWRATVSVRSRCSWTAATVRRRAANGMKSLTSSSACVTTTSSWPVTTWRASVLDVGLSEKVIASKLNKSNTSHLINDHLCWSTAPPNPAPHSQLSTSLILAVVVSIIVSGVALICAGVILSKRLLQLCVQSVPSAFQRLWAQPDVCVLPDIPNNQNLIDSRQAPAVPQLQE